MIAPKYRATLEDGDSTRERPLTIYGDDLKEIRRWADVVLPKALDGAVVIIHQCIEQQIEIIPKKKEPKS